MTKVLIIHGPNMNFIGLQSAKDGSRITIDKIDRALLKKAKSLEVKLKIIRTHDESKAVTFIQRNRKVALGIVISPSSWHHGGFTISDTVHFLDIPYSTVSLNKIQNSLFYKGTDFCLQNAIESYEYALENLVKNLNA